MNYVSGDFVTFRGYIAGRQIEAHLSRITINVYVQCQQIKLKHNVKLRRKAQFNQDTSSIPQYLPSSELEEVTIIKLLLLFTQSLQNR